MARMPIELALVGDGEEVAITEAMERANSLQAQFDYLRLPAAEEQQFRMLGFSNVRAPALLDKIAEIRSAARGFHPFLIALLDAPVEGEDYKNLFGSSRAEDGLGILTSSNVPDIIIPKLKMVAYYLYYFARYAHCFIAPSHKNHVDTRGCIYDRKVDKRDLLKSMRAGAFCDDCRHQLVSGDRPLSASQFAALEAIFGECGRIVSSDLPQPAPKRPKIFVGSSREGLPLARKVQASLADEFAIEIWNQGGVFGLGTSTLEALEVAVGQYDFGVFLFTPDDQLVHRGESKPVARDNVIFELGLFAGKLGRRRAFVVKPRGSAVSLPSDLAGITTAGYDSEASNLSAAIEPACEKIREAVLLANKAMELPTSGRR